MKLVVKLGGAGAADAASAKTLAREIGRRVAAGDEIVLVHGGGKQLTHLATRLGLPTEMVAGRRVTDDAQIALAKMAFAGEVGTDLAALFHAVGVKAVALSGVGGGILQVRRRPPQTVRDDATGAMRLVDYGWVGDVIDVDTTALKALTSAQVVPIVASLGVDAEGGIYNVNADTVASAIAGALRAKLVLLTDVGGVLRSFKEPDSLIASMTLTDSQAMIDGGAASGGMLPKLSAVNAALRTGAEAVHIAAWMGESPLSAALNGGGTVIS